MSDEILQTTESSPSLGTAGQIPIQLLTATSKPVIASMSITEPTFFDLWSTTSEGVAETSAVVSSFPEFQFDIHTTDASLSEIPYTDVVTTGGGDETVTATEITTNTVLTSTPPTSNVFVKFFKAAWNTICFFC